MSNTFSRRVEKFCRGGFSRDVVPNKKGVGMHPKIAILKQLQRHFEAKR